MKNVFFIFALLVSFFIGAAFVAVPVDNCPSPQNVSVISKIGGNIHFDWEDCSGGCDGYVVKYVRQEDGFASSLLNTDVSSCAFNNLITGTYNFYFAVQCGGQVSSFIIVQETIIN